MLPSRVKKVRAAVAVAGVVSTAAGAVVVGGAGINRLV